MCEKSATGKKCSLEDDPPNINWAQHVTALENFSSRYNFLYSNFLFSLPTQKPCSESSGKEIRSTRPISCNIQKTGRLQTLQIEKAWKTLFSSQHKRGYPRPGITAPVKTLKNNATTTDGLGSSNTLTETESFQRSGLSGHRNLPTYQRGQNLSYKSEAGNCGSSQISIANRKAMGGFKVLQENLKGTSIISGYSSPKNCDPWHTDDDRYAGRNHADAMDDEILENIDVDQIVMNHYQVMGTHQSSVSKSMPFCPNSIESTVTSSQWNSLPQELCEQCKHGFELEFCPEALNHLQDKKDRLITISNELLDNSDMLSPKKFENLCQERLFLNKQIHQLQIHLEDGIRQSSHAMASISPVHGFHLDTPLSRIPAGSLRSVPDVHVQNKFGVSGDWNSPPSFSTTEVLKFSNAPIEREVLPPKVHEVTCIEGSSDKRWKSFEFLWTKKLEAYNRKIFGNHSFRPNQREVINATMSGYDVFVLMPTGGGKSLTYQLPSLLCRGLTLVVSPLVSLIQDQIMHLLQANIPAAYFTASMEWAEQQEILRELQSDTSKYKLLFVTPEKIAKSEALLRILDALYSRESLSRIVIDEAHCVSEWGHDFRPDYQGLGILKQKYPNTPVLALTATATASVKEDVVRALGLSNCIIFKQTFNRSNLWYSIVPKTSKCLNDIDKFIKDNHFDECGIIYCLSRMDCEKVAEKLQECGHKASFYHGSMDSQQRAHTQKQWSKDELNIICATVAFGMGINKPDVRFVIHHSLPKSIEGYHQECGRAGRDGLRSSCVLYYNYGDYIRVKHMLMQGVLEHSLFATGSRNNLLFSTDRVLETNLENLLRMVNYCENDSDCRRVLQLIHFGEKFNPLDCQKTCDNCCKMLNFVERDVTDIARQLLDLIKEMGCQFTMSHILEVYKGSMKTNIKKHKHYHLSLHGAGKHLPRGEASRVMRHLVIMDILTEEVKKSDIYGSISSVLKVNDSKARNIYSGEQTITLRFPSCAKAYMNKSTIPLAKASSFMKTNFEQQTPVRAQIEADLNLSAKLYAALRRLRTILVKEADEGVMAYHIFGNATLQQLSKKIPKTKEELLEINGIGKAKMLKYGDRVLETIESVIREQLKGNKNSSSSENDTSKRKRGPICLEPVANDDDFDQNAVQLRTGAMNAGSSRKCLSENLSISSYNDRLIDLELDGYGTQNEQ